MPILKNPPIFVSYSSKETNMKRLAILIVIILLSQNIKLYAQELEYGFVEYVDSINSYSNLKMAKQVKRECSSNRENKDGVLYSRLGKFEVTYEDNYFMTDGVKHCLKMALDTWEDKLTIYNPIKFHVCISEDLPEDIAIKTIVGYTRKTLSSSIPDNLGRQENINISTHDTITINALLDWNASWPYDDTYTGNINMTVGFLRHITHILGFGTSLVQTKDNIGFSIDRSPSPFDRLLYNDEEYLSDLRNANQQQFQDFFKQPLHLHSESFDYKLYDSDFFLDHKCGNYFSLGFDNIMEYPWNNQEKLLDINQEMINVIKAIGWETSSHNAKINSANTDILGYGSFYNEQTFTLQKDGITMSPQTWTCKILNPKNKQYETISTNIGEKFTITPILNDLYLDEYSCLNYRIECSLDECIYTFPLYLDTHPVIEDIEITNIEKTDNRHYRYLLNIKQKGAKGGTILATDDTGTSLEYSFTGTPILVESLVSGYTSYIDVTLYNDYGSTSRFVVLNDYPFTDIQKTKSSDYNIITKNSSIEITSDKKFNIEIYSMSGNLVVSRNSILHYLNRFPRGIYILKLGDNESKKQITKKITL